VETSIGHVRAPVIEACASFIQPPALLERQRDDA
jgi:hypothetical protein